MANPEMMREFLENPEGKRNRKAEVQARKRQPMRRTPLAPMSDEMERNKKRWALIKQSMIEAQVKTNGRTECMECGTKNPKPIDLDHIIPASQNGVWFPSNAQLLCRTCHNEKHGNVPKWTEKTQ